MRSEDVERAFRIACETELRALKPGNVHIHAAGSGMTVKDFEASCDASAGPLSSAGTSIGQRILNAVQATHRAVGCNTNLGIVLLAAPLAHAALSGTAAELRVDLLAALDALDPTDAILAYEAIRLAAPGGLGESAVQDVRGTPTVSLRQAMAIAAERDLIARQYANGYSEIFAEGLPALRQALERWQDPEWAAALTYLHFLAHHPDSHVSRKFGPATAEDLRRRAVPYHDGLRDADAPSDMLSALLEFDAELKKRDVNPGTSADLCVAGVFVYALEDRPK